MEASSVELLMFSYSLMQTASKLKDIVANNSETILKIVTGILAKNLKYPM